MRGQILLPIRYLAMSRTVDARTKALVEPVAREIRAATSDPKADAVAEREQASFDANELAVYMQGGQSVLDRKCVWLGVWARKPMVY